MFNFTKLFILSTLFIPTIVLAATPTNFAELLGVFVGLLSSLIPLIIGLAVLVFLMGIAKYIWHGGNETKREEGKTFMIWGIVGLFVMVSFWGIIELLDQTFFDTGGGSADIEVIFD